MIIIDEHADDRLMEILATLKDDSFATRCIYFRLMGRPAVAGLKEALVASARQHLSDDTAQIYFFSDGDLCILAGTLPSKEGNRVILDMVELLHIPAESSWVQFQDLGEMLPVVQQRATARISLVREVQAREQQRREQQQQAAKRASILAGRAQFDSAQIAARRAERHSVQMMMIEDDAFSSRLVENVLQKKYAIASLTEANYALETYARLAPDLLFLDINLPDVTGHELLDRILAMDPEAYVVMLSGNADRENITQAMRRGAKGFVAKPFTRDKLVQYIDRCPGIAAKQCAPAR